MAVSTYQATTGVDPVAEQRKYMTAQSPTGGASSYVAPPTMTPAGPVLQPPKPTDLTPSIPTQVPTLQPAAPPKPAAPAAPTPSLTSAAPGSTAPAGAAANLAISAPTATLVNGQYTVNGKAAELPKSNGELPYDQTAAANPYTPGSGTTTGMLDWGLPGSGLGVPADPTGAAQAAAGYRPWDPNTNGPVATDANSPLYKSGRLPLSDGKFIDGRTVDQVTHPAAQVVPYGQPGAGSSMAGQPLSVPAAAGPRMAPPTSANDVRPSIPAPAPQQLAPAAPAAAAPASTSGAGVSTRPLTGQEGPYRVDPTQSSALQALIAKLTGEATRQLDQPTIWDDELAKGIVDQQKRGIEEDYTKAGDSLNAELASRGINWSSIAGSRVTDLATRRAQALGDVDTNIAHERANALAAGRASAFGNASSLGNTMFGQEQTLQNAERGEREYQTNTQQQAWQNAMQEALAGHSMSMDDQNAWMQAIQAGLGYGQGTAGTSALGQASSINNATGQQYGSQAAAGGEDLSSLIQYAMQFFGGQ